MADRSIRFAVSHATKPPLDDYGSCFRIEPGSCSRPNMPQLPRITRDPAVMGGKPCIRGMRVTVGTVVGLVAAGRTRDEILREYPYLEAEDIVEALSYAAWRAEEVEVPLRQP
jgi:uncharacterized protein (DUF433 family)